MNLKALSIMLCLSNFAFGSVFSDDDRLNYHEFSTEIKEVAKSSIALIHKHKLEKVGKFYKVVAKSLAESMNFCDDANFSKEPQGANCSGALINKNHILTAAHCVTNDMKGYGMNDYYIVFNYKKSSEKQSEYLIPSEDVFTMVKEVHSEFNMSTNWNDIAIYKLNRSSTNKPAKIDFGSISVGDKIYMLGYPLGVPLKLSSGESITSINDNPNSFRHQLDTFSVNSGSPIFNSSNKIIGVLARGTGSNYEQYGRSCNDWGRGDRDKDFSAANTVKSIEDIVKGLN